MTVTVNTAYTKRLQATGKSKLAALQDFALKMNSMAFSSLGDSFKLSGSAPTYSNATSPIQVEICGGYDLNFVGTIHERFLCPICSKVMRDPQLVVCCGLKYCHSCLRSYRTGQKDSCPNCHLPFSNKGFHYVAEKGMRGEIESFVVQCPLMMKGCEWTGEVKEVGTHLRSVGGCGAFEVECPNKCLAGRKGGVLKLPRKNLSHHLSYQCELRQVKCPHCDYSNTAKSYSIHKSVCVKFPVACPNGCGEVGLIRETVPAHRSTCPLEDVTCEYSTEGCKGHAKRKDMPRHMEECRDEHMGMVARSNQRLREELETMKLKMEVLTAEVVDRKYVVQQELMLLENRVQGDRLWLRSLGTQFMDQRCLSKGEELYFRMFRYGEIRTGMREWSGPLFKVRDSELCLRVTPCADVANIAFHICLMRVADNATSLPLLWTESLTVRIKMQGTAALPQQPAPSKSSRRASLKARQSSLPSIPPPKDMEYSWRMPDNFSLADCKREGSRRVLHSCKVAITQEWEKSHVQDDSLMWTVSMSV